MGRELTKKERMEIPRQSMPAQDPMERIGNFDEVALGYTPEMAILEAERCLECKKPKCVEGCPVGIDIPAFNGDASFTLPVPASYVIDTDGIIRFHFINVDYTQRLEPDELLRVLRGQ